MYTISIFKYKFVYNKLPPYFDKFYIFATNNQMNTDNNNLFKYAILKMKVYSTSRFSRTCVDGCDTC